MDSRFSTQHAEQKQPSVTSKNKPDIHHEPWKSWLVKVPGILKFHIGFWSHFLILQFSKMSSPFTVGSDVVKNLRSRRSSIWVTDRLRFWEKPTNGRCPSQSRYTIFSVARWWWNFNSYGSTIRIVIVNSWRYTKKKSWCFLSIFIGYYAILASPRNLASFLLEFASKIHHVFNSNCSTPQESGIRHSGTHFFCLHISFRTCGSSDFLRTDGPLEFFKKCSTTA